MVTSLSIFNLLYHSGMNATKNDTIFFELIAKVDQLVAVL